MIYGKRSTKPIQDIESPDETKWFVVQYNDTTQLKNAIHQIIVRLDITVKRLLKTEEVGNSLLIFKINFV